MGPLSGNNQCHNSGFFDVQMKFYSQALSKGLHKWNVNAYGLQISALHKFSKVAQRWLPFLVLYKLYS